MFFPREPDQRVLQRSSMAVTALFGKTLRLAATSPTMPLCSANVETRGAPLASTITRRMLGAVQPWLAKWRVLFAGHAGPSAAAGNHSNAPDAKCRGRHQFYKCWTRHWALGDALVGRRSCAEVTSAAILINYMFGYTHRELNASPE